MNSTKRLLIFLGLLLVTAGIGFALYSLFFAPEPTDVVVTPPDDVTPGTGLPSAGEDTDTGVVIPPDEEPEIVTGAAEVADGGLTQVRTLDNSPTEGVSMTSSGTLSYYKRSDGRFYRIGADGEPKQLTSKQFFNVSEATFDPDGTKAILEYPDGANVVYDFETNKQVTLPQHWEDFSFNSRGSEIVAKSIGIDESNRWIVVSGSDGSAPRAVQEMGSNADKVDILPSPDDKIIATSRTGRSLGPTTKEVYFVGKNHENFRSMIVEGLNMESKWSPSGEQLLYSTSSADNDYKPTLWIVDATGDDIGRNRRSLSVDTWAEKCTFQGSDTLYCAIPDELVRGAGLQPKLSDYVPDTIYKIDLNSGLRTKIAIPEGSHTVGELMVTPDNSKLYFTDKTTGILNQINLK